MNCPRILVLSNNAISTTDSNGRTLGNFFINYPKELISQFCINFNNPNYDICNNYYVISDSTAFQSYCKNKNYEYTPNNRFKVEKKFKKKKISCNFLTNRNALTMLLRNRIWSSYKWKGKSFDNWLNNFNPQLVLLQIGDLPFMYDFAVKISTDLNIPIILYNSENYYFKEYCYFKDKKFDFLYPKFHKKLISSFDNLMSHVSGCIYISEELKKLYEKKFNNDSIFIMTSSSLPKIRKELFSKNENKIVTYFGNLSNNRHKSIIEIAKSLQEINSHFKLDVYGKIYSKKVEQELQKCSAINYKGFLSYEEITNIIINSDLLIHAESMDDFYIKDIEYGFSTKLADCLASGVPLLMYSSDKLKSYDYLKKNACAFLVNKSNDLKNILFEALYDDEKRNQIVFNALKIAKCNHEIASNSQKFIDFIMKFFEKYGGN